MTERRDPEVRALVFELAQASPTAPVLDLEAAPVTRRRAGQRRGEVVMAAGRYIEAGSKRRIPGPLLAAAVAAIVLVAFGGILLILNWPEGEMAVTTAPPVTTTTALVTTTASPPATTSTTGAATSTAASEVGLPAITLIEPTPGSLVMTWEQVSPSAFADGVLLSIVAGGPGLIAVGAADDGHYGDGAVWVSPDGRAWTEIAGETGALGGLQNYGLHDGDQRVADVVAWREGFAAVGADGNLWEGEYDAAVWLSTDELTWSRVPGQDALGGPKTQEMNAITGGGPGLVAVGRYDATLYDPQAAVWLSADGLDWTRVDPAAIEGGGAGQHEGGIPEGALMSDVAAGGPGLIAVGLVWPYGEFDAAAWVSADGSEWERILLNPGVEGEPSFSAANAVAVGAHGAAAVGSVGDGRHTYGAVWLSEDGLLWRLAAVLDAGVTGAPDNCSYKAEASDAAWYGDTLLVIGTATTHCQTQDQYGLVWATADRGETWHELARIVGPWAAADRVEAGHELARIIAPGEEASGLLGHRVVVLGGGTVWLGTPQAE